MLTAEWSIKPRVGGSEQKLKKSPDAPNPSSKSKPKPNRARALDSQSEEYFMILS